MVGDPDRHNEPAEARNGFRTIPPRTSRFSEFSFGPPDAPTASGQPQGDRAMTAKIERFFRTAVLGLAGLALAPNLLWQEEVSPWIKSAWASEEPPRK